MIFFLVIRMQGRENIKSDRMSYNMYDDNESDCWDSPNHFGYIRDYSIACPCYEKGDCLEETDWLEMRRFKSFRLRERFHCRPR